MEKNLKETFNDENSFQYIFNNIYSENQSFLKTKDFQIRVEFLDYSDGRVKFKIPQVKDISERCIIFTRDKENYISIANLQFVERQGQDIFIFYPKEIQKVYSPRKEERKTLESDSGGKAVLYIINIMPDFLIRESLASYKKRLNQISETIKIKLEKIFPHIRIFFMNEGVDMRMNYFRESIVPIFISNLNDKSSEDDEEYSYYIENIYKMDNFLLNTEEFISEISVPILFRSKLPYGFVQVNGTKPFTEHLMSIVKKMAVIVNELLQKHKIFYEIEEKLIVSNISKGGFGIVFKDRKYIKYFKEGCLLYSDLLLPDNKKINLMVLVKHISIMSNKVYKVGCEIRDIDALSEVYYDEYLESVGLSAN